MRAGVRVERGFLALTVRWRGRAVLEAAWGDDTDARHQLPAETLRILRVRPEALHWEATAPFAAAHRVVTAVDPLLARALTTRLGGDLRVDEASVESDHEQEIRLVFPVDVDRD